jgi:hypothetical protein
VRLHAPRRRRLRAGTLRAIAEVAGEQAFSAADRAAVERLIRIKLRTERPEASTGGAPCGPWLALPTGDQAAILAALDLSDPRPVTMRLGFAAFYCDSHGMADDKQREGRVFVTPLLDGWTLVLGAWYARWGTGKREIDACRELSARFGDAQSFWFDAQTGRSSWLICSEGKVVRWYDEERPKRTIGPRLPVEQGRLLPHEDPDIPESDLAAWDHNAPDAARQWKEICERNGVPDSCHALTVAAAMSISPDSLGPDTQTRRPRHSRM